MPNLLRYRDDARRPTISCKREQGPPWQYAMVGRRLRRARGQARWPVDRPHLQAVGRADGQLVVLGGPAVSGRGPVEEFWKTLCLYRANSLANLAGSSVPRRSFRPLRKEISTASSPETL